MTNQSAGRFGYKICRKIVLLLMVVSLLVGCGSSAGNTGPQVSSAPVAQETSTQSFTLAYTATDSLNPYLAKTKTNQELSRLLYDGLIVLDNAMNVVNRLAQSVETQGPVVIVTLKEAWFTDGSRVTAQDVIASYQAALQGEYLSYKNDFQNVKEVTATPQGAVQFTLNFEDPYFVNFLDFPIYKKGTENQQNTDNKTLPPVGCGRYVFHEESGVYWLSANPKWWGGSVATAKIELLNLPDDDAIYHGVQVGTVKWYYSDLKNNTLPGGATLASKQVPLQNLVYVGCNLNSSLVSNDSVRMAVSYAINRQTIAETAYFGSAVPAKGMYPSGLQSVAGLQSASPQSDKQKALEWLEKAGYTAVDENGYRIKEDKVLALRIIYNEENAARAGMANLLATQLKEIGCNVTLQAFSFAEYQDAIKNENYDLYIGEMKIPDNLTLFPFITAGGLIPFTPDDPEKQQEEEEKKEESEEQPEESEDSELATSPEPEQTITAAIAAYRYHTGQGSLAEMVSCFNEQLPVIPVCHRTGMLLYSNSISGTFSPLADDPFFGIETCTIK